jgi:hypothetical protein
MCLTCGCNDAHKSMGNNLTYEDIREVAVANGKTVDDTLKMMNTTAAADKARHTDEYQRPSDIGQD